MQVLSRSRERALSPLGQYLTPGDISIRKTAHQGIALPARTKDRLTSSAPQAIGEADLDHHSTQNANGKR